MSLILATDGACDLKRRRGGYAFFTGEKIVCGPVIDATNNIAEYTAVIKLLEYLISIKQSIVGETFIYTDSELVVNQLNGIYRVRHPNMIPLHQRAKELLRNMRVSVRWIPRDQISEIDRASKVGLESSVEADYDDEDTLAAVKGQLMHYHTVFSG
jgi:ribonuclease HI